MIVKREYRLKCEYCNEVFYSTLLTKRYCSNQCIKRASKERLKEGKLKELKKRIVRNPKEKEPLKIEQQYYTPTETAQMLRCSRRYVYRLMNEGSLSYRQLSEKKRLIDKQEIDKYLDAVKVKKESHEKKDSLSSFDFDNSVSLSDAQLIYGISSLNIMNIARNKSIRHIKVGGIYFIDKQGLDRYFKENGKD